MRTVSTGGSATSAATGFTFTTVGSSDMSSGDRSIVSSRRSTSSSASSTDEKRPRSFECANTIVKRTVIKSKIPKDRSCLMSLSKSPPRKIGVVSSHENVDTGKTTKIVLEHKHSGDETTLWDPKSGLGEYPELKTAQTLRTPKFDDFFDSKHSSSGDNDRQTNDEQMDSEEKIHSPKIRVHEWGDVSIEEMSDSYDPYQDYHHGPITVDGKVTGYDDVFNPVTVTTGHHKTKDKNDDDMKNAVQKNIDRCVNVPPAPSSPNAEFKTVTLQPMSRNSPPKLNPERDRRHFSLCMNSILSVCTTGREDKVSRSNSKEIDVKSRPEERKHHNDDPGDISDGSIVLQEIFAITQGQTRDETHFLPPEECPICLESCENWEQTASTSCNHHLHTKCFQLYVNSGPKVGERCHFCEYVVEHEFPARIDEFHIHCPYCRQLCVEGGTNIGDRKEARDCAMLISNCCSRRARPDDENDEDDGRNNSIFRWFFGSLSKSPPSSPRSPSQ